MIFFLLIQHIQSEGRFYVPPVLLSSYHPLFKSLPLLPIMSQLLRPSGDVLLFHTSLIISVGLWVHEGGLVMVRYCSFLFILSFMGFSLCQIPRSPRLHSGLSWSGCLGPQCLAGILASPSHTFGLFGKVGFILAFCYFTYVG